ncbi:MAG TPA: dephospho-CoA kinase [Opitutaceae bacterium]|nr:dephospho-CoA kinase [Opitutaceae bacterium]
MPEGKNLIVGLTGGMGCGKSTAAGLFAEHGFRRHDSDQYIRDVLYRDAAIVSALAGRLGPDVLTPAGEVWRERVAAKVFGDDAALAWLEDLLHPRLLEHWRAEFAAPGAPWIVEVPLLFEKGLEIWFDFTICVTADSAQQLRRLEQRGIPPELARRRLAKQMPLARKCELADFVLLNDGTLAFLREQVDHLAGRLVAPAP